MVTAALSTDDGVYGVVRFTIFAVSIDQPFQAFCVESSALVVFLLSHNLDDAVGHSWSGHRRLDEATTYVSFFGWTIQTRH